VAIAITLTSRGAKRTRPFATWRFPCWRTIACLAEELGILDPIEKVPLRATYLLDPERKIRWLCVNDLSVGRSTGEVLRVLAALQCGELCPANWNPGQATLERPTDKGVHWETKEHPVLH
jgi:alkyl hydroperoxide reductase subunit AhpC